MTWPDATVQTCVVHMVRNSFRDPSEGTPDDRGRACGITITSDIAQALDRRSDVLIDSTNPSVWMKHVKAAIEQSVPAVIGTTGFTAEEFDQVDDAAQAAGVGLVRATCP